MRQMPIQTQEYQLSSHQGCDHALARIGALLSHEGVDYASTVVSQRKLIAKRKGFRGTEMIDVPAFNRETNVPQPSNSALVTSFRRGCPTIGRPHPSIAMGDMSADLLLRDASEGDDGQRLLAAVVPRD